jgi:hypothetical protein
MRGELEWYASEVKAFPTNKNHLPYRDGLKIPVLITALSGCSHEVNRRMLDNKLTAPFGLSVDMIDGDTTTDTERDGEPGDRFVRTAQEIAIVFPTSQSVTKAHKVIFWDFLACEIMQAVIMQTDIFLSRTGNLPSRGRRSSWRAGRSKRWKRMRWSKCNR